MTKYWPFDTKTTLTAGITAALYAVAVVAGLTTLQRSFNEYIAMIWWAVLLGFFIAGIIDYFVPDEFITSLLNESRYSLGYAVLAGFLLSACSHGILALSMELYKKGASIPSVVAFLLATPWANLPVTVLLFGFFGAQALLIIAAAIIIALITGAAYKALQSIDFIKENPHAAETTTSEWKALKEFNATKAVSGVWNGAVSLANMVLWWILIGVAASAIIGAYVPDVLFQTYMDASLIGLLVTLGVATIIEVCSEASSPLAFEIYQSVGSLGNPFVFLMAGVVTDYTEIGLLWTTIGKRTALTLPAITVPLVTATGYLFNALP